jgi:hypothetical protein
MREVDKVKAKIICILVMTLLITTALPVIGVTIKTIENENPLPLRNGYIDQEQTTYCGYGMILSPPNLNAQSFKPTIETLTHIELWLYKNGNPTSGIEITACIREEINGTDLASKTINADDVGIGQGTWVSFNFDDITVIPEETYYIICYANGGTPGWNCYSWLFDIGDKYPRGEAWHSNDSGATWVTLWEWFEYSPEWEEPDLCFKTYWKQSKEKTINKPFLIFLENHPYLFPLLQKLLVRFGL